MIPKEILQQIRRIQFRTNRLVNDVFAGKYESIFKGRGMEFCEVREYQVGDEIRQIDWNVTARYGKPFVKRFSEERELTIMILVDMSGSEIFGTKKRSKVELGAEIAAVIAFSAMKNNDKVGLLIFTDKVEKFIPAKKTITHVLRIIRETLYYKPLSKGTNITLALEYLYRIQKKRSIVFLISDFIDENYDHALKVVSKKHDLIAIKISDFREYSIPPIGYIELKDNETGENIVIDARDFYAQKNFNEICLKEENRIKETFKKCNIDFISVTTDKSYIEPLMKFFYIRSRRFR
ncbi:MAG: DUF58 domain-containing protein [Elusimicrobiota bacterium]|nr:DUF58 domain-containing protein [Elusimicrobiota bacterium]